VSARLLYKKVSIQIVIGMVCLLSFSSQAFAFEWENLWSTPEQRAAKDFEKERYNDLINEAPNDEWQGLGEYKQGDYKSAAESFARQRKLASEAGQQEDANRATYNEANARLLDSQFEQAVSLFDDVLEANPEHKNAKHNRQIAEQLLKQQQQQQGEGEGEQQESESESGEGNSDQQQSGQENGEGQQQDQQQSSGESESDGKNQQDSEQQEAQGSGQSDEQQNGEAEDEAQAAADAAKAMLAEQEAGKDQNREADEQEANNAAPGKPLTEREQANEQWLRQIPDDPVGLLQRKIQNRHNIDYPKVKDSANPW